jgi:glycosyltransferase involved in cell wall biosynthesis
MIKTKEEIIEFLRKKNFQKRINNLAQKYAGKKIVVYGCGILFEVIKENYDLSRLNIIGVSDNKFNFENPGEFMGYKTYGSYNFMLQKPDVVLVAMSKPVFAEDFFKYELFEKFGKFKYESFVKLNRINRKILKDFNRKLQHFIKISKQLIYIFKKPVECNLMILDSLFPIHIFSWRTTEYHEYLKKIPDTLCFNISDSFKNNYLSGISLKTYKKRLKLYLDIHTHNGKYINRLNFFQKYKANLAYLLFVSQASLMLPFLEKHKIPFVFTLYPGGGFSPYHKGTEEELKKIFSSELFRKVIVTQNFTKEYLLERNLCTEEKIKLIYGGFLAIDKKNIKTKLLYKKDKETFDICFVAYKYTKDGVEKGFDLFTNTMDILKEKYNDINFHIVGNWEDNIKPYANDKNIHFYGVMPPIFLSNFFLKWIYY